MKPPIQHDLTVEGTGDAESLWQAFRYGKVSFRMRRLEPQLAWAIAAYTAWSGVFLAGTDYTVWLVAAYATTIGFWCNLFPAHRQWLMLVRGVLLLAGGFLLQIGSSNGGATGPYFIWPVMVVTAYSLLLARRWAIPLAVLALLQFVAAGVLAGVDSWRLAAAQAGVLCFFPFLATTFGRVLRDMDRQAELARMDRHSQLYNEAGFFSHGAELFDECRRKKRPFSMVLLNSADLRDVSDLVGKKAANQLFAQLVGDLAKATPREGLAARTDMVEFALALPGLTAEKAGALLHNALGDPPKVELAAKASKVTVILDSVIAEATPDVPTMEDFYDRLHERMLKRFNVELPTAPDKHSTLLGLLEEDKPMPHFERPTMPMGYGKPAKRGR